MEWLIPIILKILDARFQKYKEKIKQLRDFLNEFEKETEPKIKVESDDELLIRAKDYLERFKGQGGVFIDGSLLPVIERLVNEIDSIRETFWFRRSKRHFTP